MAVAPSSVKLQLIQALWESSLESQVQSTYVFKYSRVIHGNTNFDIMN